MKTLCVNLMGVVLLEVGGAVRVGGRIHMDIYPAFHLLIPGRSDREGSQALDSTQADRRRLWTQKWVKQLRTGSQAMQ